MLNFLTADNGGITSDTRIITKIVFDNIVKFNASEL